MAREITVGDLAAKLAADEPVFLLDIRQPEEHSFVSLPGSRLIPLNELAGRVNEIQPPAGTPVVVYCHHGIRSLHAANFLESQGVPNIVSLSGGIDAWSRLIDPSLPRY
jgi:rhodanese-related sulfurtransferase